MTIILHTCCSLVTQILLCRESQLQCVENQMLNVFVVMCAFAIWKVENIRRTNCINKQRIFSTIKLNSQIFPKSRYHRRNKTHFSFGFVLPFFYWFSLVIFLFCRMWLLLLLLLFAYTVYSLWAISMQFQNKFKFKIIIYEIMDRNLCVYK